MSRAEVEADIRETIGIVPEFIAEVPDFLIETEWQSFKGLMLSETEIPNKYKELIGLGVFGATEEEINEAALVAKNTMGWSTYLNTRAFDYDRFTKEFDQIAEYVRSQMAAAV